MIILPKTVRVSLYPFYFSPCKDSLLLTSSLSSLLSIARAQGASAPAAQDKPGRQSYQRLGAAPAGAGASPAARRRGHRRAAGGGLQRNRRAPRRKTELDAGRQVLCGGQELAEADGVLLCAGGLRESGQGAGPVARECRAFAASRSDVRVDRHVFLLLNNLVRM